MLATMLAAVRLPALATLTTPDQQTTSKPVVVAEAASREASAAGVATTGAECAVASTRIMETRT